MEGVRLKYPGTHHKLTVHCVLGAVGLLSKQCPITSATGPSSIHSKRFEGFREIRLVASALHFPVKRRATRTRTDRI